MNAAVFLDRDNTIIHNDSDLGDPAQVRLIQGAASAIASLKGLGYRIIVVSNQGGVARGRFTEANVDAVHERINELIRANSGIGIDRFYYCPYHPEGTEERYRRDHPWRKPRPGMLLQAAKDLGLDLRQSWMIGDAVRDVQAGFSAGAIPILLSDKPEVLPPPMLAAPPGTDERDPNPPKVRIEPVRDYFIVKSLIEAVRLVGQQRRPENVTLAMQTQRESVVPRAVPRMSGAAFRNEEVDQAIAPLRLSGAGQIKGEAEVAAEEVPAPFDETEFDDVESETESTEAQHEDDALNDDASAEAMNETERAADPLEQDFEQEMAAAAGEVEPQEEVKAPKPAAPRRTKARRKARKNKAVKAEAATAKAVDAPPAQTAPPAQKAAAAIDAEKDRESAKVEASATVAAPTPAPKPPTAMPLSRVAAPVSPVAPAAPAAPPSPPAPSAPAAPAATPVPSITPAAAKAREDDKKKVSEEGDLSELPADQTLRQILQELRNQRQMHADFSFAGVLAIITQMVAIVCLVAGLLMGAGNTDTFLRWIGCAIVLELMTIATLLFKK